MNNSLVDQLTDMRDFCNGATGNQNPHRTNVARLCDAVLEALRGPTVQGFTLERGKLDATGPNYTIPMILHCPQCRTRHIDEEEFAEVAHHTHACQGCGFVWRPAKVNTHGVQFLPGYTNAEASEK